MPLTDIDKCRRTCDRLRLIVRLTILLQAQYTLHAMYNDEAMKADIAARIARLSKELNLAIDALQPGDLYNYASE